MKILKKLYLFVSIIVDAAVVAIPLFIPSLPQR